MVKKLECFSFPSLQLDQDMYDVLVDLEQTDTTRLVSNDPSIKISHSNTSITITQ